jgi:hypothetical protein
MGFVSKHPIATGCLLIPMAIVIGLISLLVPAAYQNYRGICRKVGRVLTDEELIRQVVAQINDRPSFSFLSENGFVHYPYVAYPSVDEFLGNNPDCCRVTSLGNDTDEFSLRLEGAAYKHVSLRYIVRYRDAEGIQRETVTSSDGAYLVGNCGEIFGE